MKALTIIATVVTLLLQCSVSYGLPGLDRGPVAFPFRMLANVLVSLPGDPNPVPDDGQKDPVEHGGYRYRGAPRYCKNMYDCLVEPGQKSGKKHLCFMRQVELHFIYEVYYWEDDVLVYEGSPDADSIYVAPDESKDWDLMAFYSYGLSIHFAQGTMTGRPMKQATALGALAIGVAAFPLLLVL